MANRIFIRSSTARACPETVAYLKSTFDYQVQMEPRIKEAGFLLSARLAVTKIKSEDFYNKELEEKLVEMAQTMNEYFPRPYLILEGSLESSEYGDTVMSMLTRTNIRVLYSSGSFETASLLSKLSRREFEKGHYFMPDISNWPKSAIDQLDFYYKLPGVNYALALLMTHDLESPSELIFSDTNTVMKKLQLSEKKVELIRSFFCKAAEKTNGENEPQVDGGLEHLNLGFVEIFYSSFFDFQQPTRIFTIFWTDSNCHNVLTKKYIHHLWDIGIY